MLQITKVVEFTKEVEIPVTAEDISQCLMTSPLEDRKEAAVIMISDCMKVLKGIPDTVIAELHLEFRKTVSEFLATSARQYHATDSKPSTEKAKRPLCVNDGCTFGTGDINCSLCINRNIVAKRGFELIQIIENVPASVQQTSAVTAAFDFIKFAEDLYLSQGE